MADGGIFLPEYALHALMKSLADLLNAGTFASSQIDVFAGSIPADVLANVWSYFSTAKVKVGFTYPADESSLPWISIVPESWAPAAQFLGDTLSEPGDTITTLTDAVVLASAAGGETSVTLAHTPIVPSPFTVKVNGTALGADAYSVNLTTGVVTFVTPLSLHDAVTATYSYYVDGVVVIGEVSDHRFRVFAVTNNPDATIILGALVWRTLMVGRPALRSNGGLDNVRVTSDALSPWNDALPNFGFRKEFAVSGIAAQSVVTNASYVRQLLGHIDTVAGRAVDFEITRSAT